MLTRKLHFKANTMLTEQDVLNEIRRHPGLSKTEIGRRLGVTLCVIDKRMRGLEGQFVIVKGIRSEKLIYHKDYAAANGIEPDQIEEAGMVTRSFDKLMPVTSASQ